MRVGAILQIVAVIVCALAGGCEDEGQSQSAGTKVKDFTLSIEGDAGLEVDMLLIRKPTANSIEREAATVTVPLSKSFRAAKCAVWIDHEFRGRAGEYRVVLKEDGKPIGELECKVKEGNKGSGRLGTL